MLPPEHLLASGFKRWLLFLPGGSCSDILGTGVRDPGNPELAVPGVHAGPQRWKEWTSITCPAHGPGVPPAQCCAWFPRWMGRTLFPRVASVCPGPSECRWLAGEAWAQWRGQGLLFDCHENQGLEGGLGQQRCLLKPWGVTRSLGFGLAVRPPFLQSAVPLKLRSVGSGPCYRVLGAHVE